MPIASSSVNHILPDIFNSGIGLISIILSAFFGGLFAGLWSNYFESKRRIKDKRFDKYFEHRNTIVQIEHELMPLRVNVSRNLASIDDAISNTKSSASEIRIRFILRLYKLFFSTGLNLNLLNVDLINKYAQLYSDIESFNSDIEYLSSMVSMIMEDHKNNKDQPGLMESYKELLPVLKEKCEEIDQKSLDLLSICQVALNIKNKKLVDKYIQDGEEIKYVISQKSLQEKIVKIKKQEDDSSLIAGKRPKFYSPFLDFIRVPISQS